MTRPKFVELYELSYVYNSFSKRPPIFGWYKDKQFQSLQEVLAEIGNFFNPRGRYPGDSGYEFIGTKVGWGSTIFTFGIIPGHRQDLDSRSDQERTEYYRIKDYHHIRVRYKLLLPQ